MIWGAHWCLMFYLFSANVRAGLSGKPQAENLVSEISVLKDTELGKSKARRERESFFSLVFTASEAKPKPPEAGASPRHSLPVGSGSEASKEGIQAVHAAATCQRQVPIPSCGPSYTRCPDSGRRARIGV